MKKRPYFILYVFLLLLLLTKPLIAQPPAPCTNGSQPTCKCTTAPILCTIDQLDGYTYSMTSYQHPGDGPNPLCASQGGVPNNPTWFAFKAWCTSLTLNADVSNCTTVGGWTGIQIAIYSSCAPTYTPIACNVDPDSCNTNDKILTMNNLNIGQTYYFMVDGCNGSYCTVTIDVVGVCGDEVIEPWKSIIIGDSVICATKTENYNVLPLNGATHYKWTLDGATIKDGTQPNVSVNWNTAGTFNLCVDAYNNPCIPITADPPILCKTIYVYETNAGTLSVTPQPACPGATVTYSVSGQKVSAVNQNYLILTDASGIIQEITTNTSAQFTQTHCGDFKVYSYNVAPAQPGGPNVPMVGDNINSISCAAPVECCKLINKDLKFTDSQIPSFPTKPANQSLTCYDLLQPMQNLNYTDNCLPAGAAEGIETGSANLCDGGTITRTWTVKDSCNNQTTHTQTINISKPAVSNWVNPPANQTVSCANIPTTHPNLSYTNNGTGACLLSGSITPDVTGSANLCGGTITRTWTYTDSCGTSKTHTQTITATPVPQANWISPPSNKTWPCDSIPTSHPNLNYDNNESGACKISGTVTPVVTGSANLCGGVITRTWSFTDSCGNSKTHTQTLTFNPVAQANWVNPPANVTVVCDSIPTTNPNLNYTNNGNGGCVISGTAIPTVTGGLSKCGGTLTRTWTFTDTCGNAKTHTQTVTATPVPQAVWLNPPPNKTWPCDSIPTSHPNLLYSNNINGPCSISGSATPTVTGSANLCGGTITRTWTFTDTCGNAKTHTQTITITPVAQASFVNPPANKTVSCDSIPTSNPTLAYTNSGTPGCTISGVATPDVTGGLSKCGGTLTRTWTFTDTCGNTKTHTQTITATPVPQATWLNPPSNKTWPCDSIPTSHPNLLYSNNIFGACGISGSATPTVTGSANECGGTITRTWTFTDTCGNAKTHTQSITITPTPQAAFINPPPATLTVNCNSIPTSAPALSYTNGGGAGACKIDGSVNAVMTGSANECGGTITFTWTFTDQCNRTIQHVQTVTVTPTPQAVFVNPPPTTVTVTCENIPTGGSALSYTNNSGTGSCKIEGTIQPTITGSANECGGTITFTWSFTDQCGRNISHTQTVTVTPTPQAAWVNPPPNSITVTCDEIPVGIPSINYTNGKTGNCKIEGAVAASVNGSANYCGGVITYVWTFTDQCGRVLNHQQTVNVTQVPAAQFISSLPGNLNLNCDDPIPDPPILTYSNGLNSQNCGINGNLAAQVSGAATVCGGVITHLWTFTDACNRVLTHQRQITVAMAPQAQFTSTPQNVTVECWNTPAPPGDLNYTNNKTGNCAITGSVPPVQTGFANICGSTITYTWTFTDPCGRTINAQKNVTILATPAPIFINVPADKTISCDNGNDQPPLLTYDNNKPGTGGCHIMGQVPGSVSGSYNECGGDLLYTWNFTDPCGRQINASQKVKVSPAPIAVFLSTPPDLTVDCDAIPVPTPLSFSNNKTGPCAINGAVPPIESGTFDGCGGTLFRTYTFTDACSRELEKTQKITVKPAPPPVYLNKPIDITISCLDAELLDPSPDLEYTNSKASPCLLDGTVQGTFVGGYDECGGTITYNWSKKVCTTTITHSQKVTVQAAPEPAFVNPPKDITLGCGVPFPAGDELLIDNAQPGGSCLISEYIAPTLIQSGNIMRYIWTWDNPCNNKKITYTQKVTGNPLPNMDVTPDTLSICQGTSVDLKTISVVDKNNTNPTITWHSGTPPNAGNQLSNLVVTPNTTTNYYVLGSGPSNCNDDEKFTIQVFQPVTAGADNADTLCYNSNNVNLTSYLSPGVTPGGIWIDKNKKGLDLSNPTKVSFVGFAPGMYPLLYTVPNNGVCKGDSAQVNLTIVQDITISIDSVKCAADQVTYSIYINAGGYNVSASKGTVNSIGGGKYQIIVTADSNTVLTVKDIPSACFKTFPINAPNCNCPPVNPPVSGGNKSVCFGSTNPTLSVTVGPNEIANWYSVPTGGSPIKSSSLTYTSTETAPGLYKYYVEAVNTVFPGCVSFIRTVIEFEIIAGPLANNGTLELCDPNGDGKEAFLLTDAIPQVNGSPSVTMTFHSSLANAQAGSNALTSPYTNTSNPQVVHTNVKNAQGCSSYSTVTLVVLPTLTASVTVKDETCPGLHDGSVTITGGGGTGTKQYSLDNSTWVNTNTFPGLTPGNYTAYVKDVKNCTGSKPFTVKDGIIMTLGTFDVKCDNNGTKTIATDDKYKITFNLTNQYNNVGTYTVVIGTTNYGPYPYGTSQTITLPANSQTVKVEFTDVTNNCKISQTAGPLTPCSTDCEITITQLEKVCNNNGTESDPSDDYYEITVNATAKNPGPLNMFVVLVDGIKVDSFNYNSGGSFTIKADNLNKSITFVDQKDGQCTASQVLGVLKTCSDKCVLSMVIDSITCDSKGTTNDFTDDVYYYYINVTGLNTGTSWYVLGNQGQTFSYGVTTKFGPFNIQGGDNTITIVDSKDAGCQITQTITAPPPCSEPCEIKDATFTIGPCDDNNTGPNDKDDFFAVTLNVIQVAGTVTTYQVTVNNKVYGPFNYGTNVIIDSIPANGKPYNIVIVDKSNPACKLTLSASQNPCSSCSQTCDAGPGKTLTCLNPVVTLNGSANPSANASYSWTGPNGFMSTLQNPVVNFPGTYYLTVSYPDQCTAMDSTIVDQDNSIPTSNGGPDQELTCVINQVTLDGTNSSQGGKLKYIWKDANGNVISNKQKLDITTPGKYYFQVIDTVANCASPIDEIVVSEDKTTPDVSIVADPDSIINCKLNAVTLFASGQPNVTYQWNLNGTLITGKQVTVTTPGTINLTATNAMNGCVAQGSIVIADLIEYPIIDISPVLPITCYNPSVTINGSGSQDGPSIVYTWTGPNGQLLPEKSDQIIVQTPGQYTFLVVDTVNGCNKQEYVIVTEKKDYPVVDAGPDINLPCGHPDTTLYGSLPNPTGKENFTWIVPPTGQITGNGNTLNPFVTGSGYFKLSVINSESGCKTVDSVFVKTNADAPWPVDMEVDTVTCFGDSDGSINVLSITGGKPPVTYVLNDQITSLNGNFGSLAAGTYTLKIVDVNNCFSETLVTVPDGNKLEIDLASSIQLIWGDSTTLEAIVNLPPNEISKVIWRPGTWLSCDSCLVTKVKALNTQQYEVTIWDRKGCKVQDYILVVVKKDIKVFIPNIFSPNNDSNNDGFTIYSDEKVKSIRECRIFDRWGELLFFKENFPPNETQYGWDGTHRGKFVNPGVYVYYFVVDFIDGSQQLFKGDVMVTRK